MLDTLCALLTHLDDSDLTFHAAGGYGAVVSVTVTNTGKISGSESVQVYVHQVAAPVQRPEIELAGFAKVTLQPGESKQIELILDVSMT